MKVLKNNRRITMWILCIAGLVYAETPIFAESINIDEAQRAAKDFISQKFPKRPIRKLSAASAMTSADSIQKNLYQETNENLHIFNVDGGGFVIVSGSDRTETILAYSTTGRYDTDSLPENQQAFIHEYAEAIQRLENQSSSYNVSTTSNDEKETGTKALTSNGMQHIAPLVTSRWGQNLPYNLYCPTYIGTHSASGCVATAMAQIMGFHRWPENTTERIPSYYTDTRNLYVSAVAANTSIDWKLIQDEYESVSTLTTAKATESQKAVANLMKMCGASIEMDYYCNSDGQSGASSQDVANAMVKYFDYEESTCQHIRRQNYSYSEWQEIIYNELDNGRPVLYHGNTDDDSGHAFVCDGYDTDDFFHINWGWNGKSDGYFRLRLLNPDNQGIGGSDTDFGYGLSQGACIGIQKNDGKSDPQPFRLTVFDLTTNQAVITRQTSNDDFYLGKAVSIKLANETGNLQSFDCDAIIIDSNGKTVDTLEILSNVRLSNNYYTSQGSIPSFGSDYSNGTYKMFFISRVTGAIEWHTCKDAELKSLGFTIDNDTLSIDVPELEVSHEVLGTYSVGSAHTIRLKIRNSGQKAFRESLYYTVDGGTQICLGLICAEADDECVVEFAYTPLTNGTHSFSFSPLDYSFDIVVGYELQTDGISLSPGLTYNPIYNLFYINDSLAEASVTIRNAGKTAFSGQLKIEQAVRYSGLTTWEYKDYPTFPEIKDCTLAAGDSIKVVSIIRKSTNADVSDYFVRFSYKAANENTFTTLATSETFTFIEPDAPHLVFKGSNYSPELQYTSAGTYYVDGTLLTANFTLENLGGKAFDGKLMYRYQTRTGYYYGTWTDIQDSLVQDFHLEAGATDSGCATIEAIAGNSNYRIVLYYIDATTGTAVFLYTTPTVEIRKPTYSLSTVGYAFTPELKSSKVSGFHADVSFSLCNRGNADFDGKILVRYQGRNTETYRYEYIQDSTLFDLHLTAGDTATITVSSDYVEGYDRYRLQFYYIDSETGVETYLSQKSYMFHEPKYELASRVENYTPTLQYDYGKKTYFVAGKKMEVSFKVTNNGDLDYDGKIVIRYKENDGTSDLWTDFQDSTSYNIHLSAGESTMVNAIILSKADTSQTMRTECYYIDDTTGEETLLEYTYSFEMRKPFYLFAGVSEICSTPLYNEKKNTYYIYGNTADVSFDILNSGNAYYNEGFVLRYKKRNSKYAPWTEIQDSTMHYIPLAVGESKKLKVEFSPKSAYDYYELCVECYYFDAETGEETLFLSTVEFYFLEPPMLTCKASIFTPALQYDAANNIHYMNNKQFKTTFSVTNELTDAAFSGLVWTEIVAYQGTDTTWITCDCKMVAYQESDTVYFVDEGEKSVFLNHGEKLQFSIDFGKTVKDDYDGYYFQILHDGEFYDVYSDELMYSTGTAILYKSPEFVISSSNLTLEECTYIPTPEYDSGAKVNYIDGTQALANITLANRGNEAYDGQVILCYMTRIGTYIDTWKETKEPLVQDFHLNPNMTEDIGTSIEIFNDYTCYRIDCYYIDQKTGVRILLGSTPVIELRKPVYDLAVIDYWFEPELESDIYTEGTSIDVVFCIENSGNANYDGKLMIRRYGRNIETKQWEDATDSETVDIHISAGATATTSISMSPVDGYDRYRARCYYINSETGATILLKTTGYFEFRTPDGIETIATTKWPDAIYNLNGQHIGTTEELDKRKSGIYMTNGRKILKH